MEGMPDLVKKAYPAPMDFRVVTLMCFWRKKDKMALITLRDQLHFNLLPNSICPTCTIGTYKSNSYAPTTRVVLPYSTFPQVDYINILLISSFLLVALEVDAAFGAFTQVENLNIFRIG